MIRGESTNLRAVERSDAGQLHHWFNDPELMRFWGVPGATVSGAEIERQIEAWIEDERQMDRPACFIIETLDGAEVGIAILGRYEKTHASVEISLMIGERERWGQGLGSDALTSLADTCFDQWNLHRVSLRVEAFNERAQRLYERCGFQRDATLREASYFDGAYQDVVVYSLLATDRVDELESGE
jgi:RimJ/RimL family protein N-acetyltransferase